MQTRGRGSKNPTILWTLLLVAPSRKYLLVPNLTKQWWEESVGWIAADGRTE